MTLVLYIFIFIEEFVMIVVGGQTKLKKKKLTLLVVEAKKKKGLKEGAKKGGYKVVGFFKLGNRNSIMTEY